MMKLLAKLEKSREFYFLLFACFGFFLLRLPSLFEPYWYGDEGIYEVIGLALRHGRLLYQGIADNKPPFLYLVYALFSGDQGPVRFLSLIVGIATLVIFYFLAKRLFAKEKTVFIATGLFGALLALPLLEGNIANSENFMVLPTVLAAYLLVRKISHNQFDTPYTKETKTFLYAGLLLGIAFLFKVVAVFDLGAFALFAFIILQKRHTSFIKAALLVIPFFAGFLIPLLITMAYFALHGILGTFLHFSFNSNVGYVNYGNTFIIPQGLLIIKLVLLGIFCGWLFFRRNRFTATHLFVGLWLAFSLFNAFFSQRPYTHYMLVLIGSISLFVGLILEANARKKQLTALLFVIVVILVTNFTFYIKTIGYYGNFLSFMTGQESVRSYRAFFDKNTPRDYDIALFFDKHQKPGDSLFVWGDNGQVYKIANTLPASRYIVAYHINATPKTIAETQKVLAKNPPRFIVVMPNKPALPVSLENYSEVVMFDEAVIYAKNN